MTHDTFERMDRMYRPQRRIYDLTRRCYLLGRNRLLDSMPIRPGWKVCEVGCGTARNLIRLGSQHPQARFVGIDASAEMLAVARAKAAAKGLSNLSLVRGIAEDLSCLENQAPFDAVFFSYSLSMIRAWERSIGEAISLVRPGGYLGIVDFSHMAGMPPPAATVLRWWLGVFHATPRPGVLPMLSSLAEAGGGTIVSAENVRWNYALIAVFQRADTARHPGL
jgi:S-adenosylmethionine-diacylgycerolhomoserine-N-methlytransferase